MQRPCHEHGKQEFVTCYQSVSLHNRPRDRNPGDSGKRFEEHIICTCERSEKILALIFN
jgi:hypothetical protein